MESTEEAKTAALKKKGKQMCQKIPFPLLLLLLFLLRPPRSLFPDLKTGLFRPTGSRGRVFF